MPVRFLPPHSSDDGGSPDPEPGRISTSDIEELVAAGEAIALMPEFDVGPTWYEGMWWVVPTGDGEWEKGFTVASEEDQTEFSRMYRRLHRSQLAYSEHRRRKEELGDRDSLTADEGADLRAGDRVAEPSDPRRTSGPTGRPNRSAN